MPGVCDVEANGFGGVAVVPSLVDLGKVGTSHTLSCATPSLSTNFKSPPMPYSARRNLSRHRNRYLRVRGGSRPRDLSCGEERVKSSSHEENLEAWSLSCRPMRVRKVGTSGTKGVGGGMVGGGRLEVLWMVRRQVLQMCEELGNGRRRDSTVEGCLVIMFGGLGGGQRAVWENSKVLLLRQGLVNAGFPMVGMLELEIAALQ